MTAAELHTLTGAYALHALAEPEREEFERHLSVCPSCAQEVAELAATAARLGLAVSEAPPRGMKRAVLERIATVRQEPPLHGRGDDAAGGTSGAAGEGRGTPRRPRVLPRLALAACLAAAAAFGGIAWWQHQEARDARDSAAQQSRRAEQRAEELARVLAAPDARTTPGRDLPGGGSGAVVVSHSRDRAAFVSSGMPEPPSGKVYQLWFDDGGTMRPAGLMDPKATGGSLLMDGRVGPASGMGITVEPHGGSQQPTSAPVALLKFPAAR